MGDRETKPFVGLPSIPGVTGCRYGGIDITGSLCGKPAAHHLAVEAEGWGLVGLETCDRHEPIARATGTVVGTHPYGSECGETCWGPEVCRG